MMPNRLAQTLSPYLLQHQDNPVDWWPWGEAAFEEAKRLDRPVFLSIGYATCHWCHVMAHESFEDKTVARLMNEAFVNIKVDREERPDVDQLYMSVCQMMTGHGGWPLTVLLFPDKRPFFAATYLPKTTRHGRLGMLDFIPRVQEAWTNHRGRLGETAEELVHLLQQSSRLTINTPNESVDTVAKAFTHLEERFDSQFGGFGNAPKFPSPHTLIFLLRYGHRTGNTHAWDMVAKTLHHMRMGGIWDHLGYGFHRYSTDRVWRLPHFEKMLYDQAMLALAYTEAFEATGDHLFEQTARDILTYVSRDMTDSAGGFYSAEDADSEGREGKFYVWEGKEVEQVLGPERGRQFMEVYSFAPEGNFEDEATRQRTGENIPFLLEPITDTALSTAMASVRQRLFEHREERIHPEKDDKVLTDWNGLMISAFARAGQVFDEPLYVERAVEGARFVCHSLQNDEGRLWHRWRCGEAGVPGMLDDYAFFIAALLDCYETTFDVRYLSDAIQFQQQLDQYFWDAEHGGYFLTADDAEALLVRQKEGSDGALPSGNSVALMNLLRLSRLTGNGTYEEKGEALYQAFLPLVSRHPSGFTALLTAWQFAEDDAFEVVIVGTPENDDTQAMIAAVRQHYVPHKVVVLRPSGPVADLVAIAPFLDSYGALDGKATAYVCHQHRCAAPTTSVEEMVKLLSPKATLPT